MYWTIKNKDNSKIKFGVVLNTDLTVDCKAFYMVKGNWIEIKNVHFESFDFTVESFTDVIVALLEDALIYETTLKKMETFFYDYKEIEFVE